MDYIKLIAIVLYSTPVGIIYAGCRQGGVSAPSSFIVGLIWPVPAIMALLRFPAEARKPGAE